MIAIMKQLDRSAWGILALSAIVLLAGLSFLRHLAEPSDGAQMDYADMPSLWTGDGVVLMPIEPQAAPCIAMMY
jgi:hypothetical protein